MAVPLVIVESPAKARTLGRYLGDHYQVAASAGHVRDLPRSDLGVDLEHDFEPVYEVIPSKERIVKELKSLAKKASEVLLAPDPDREGEAIAYHIAKLLEKETKGKNVRRVLFHEITKPAVVAALKAPLALDPAKFDSQQARRILDRLVGYKISPILWKKVQRGLSAGRVQSVAVRMIVEREREIRRFKPEEYWTAAALLEAPGRPPPFVARLVRLRDAKAERMVPAQAPTAETILKNGEYIVEKVEKKERKRYPVPPFITSTLQQEAARKLGFSAARTMAAAQELYEGVDIDGAPVGLITYMRTDSTRLSDVALGEVREFIRRRYGERSVPAKAIVYANKRNAQDAHEAIRPTSTQYPPERVAGALSSDQARLYSLIWNRFVACQMSPAVYDSTSVDIRRDGALLRATGSILRFPGFLAVYEEGRDDTPESQASAAGAQAAPLSIDAGENAEARLPELAAGDALKLKQLDVRQNFTQPPPRFTEASLVKALEENGIGRPSTYAAISATIQEKGYVEKRDGHRFHPTEVGEAVTDLLVAAFPDILDARFTARMEERLDEVEEGKAEWRAILREFHEPFVKALDQAQTQMTNLKSTEQKSGVPCPKCGAEMLVKWGKTGSFLGCERYPDCRTTMAFQRDDQGRIVPTQREVLPKPCPKCGGELVVKANRFGRFAACTRFPACDYAGPVPTGVPCPEPNCGGNLVEKQSRGGKVFYSCSRFPACEYSANDKPVAKACPRCAFPHMVLKKSGGEMVEMCPQCGYPKDRAALAPAEGEEGKPKGRRKFPPRGARQSRS